MPKNDWEQTLDDLKQEIAAIKGRAGMLSVKFQQMSRQAESFKVQFLNRRFGERRRSLARIRGYTSIMRDGKGLGVSLGVAVLGLVVAGAVTKDGSTAINAGASSFGGAVQGLGETSWAVSLGKDLTVLPLDSITSGKAWVTWESLKSALAQLKKEASQGVRLGTLDNIISRLQKCRELVYYGLPVAKPIRLEEGKQ